MFGTCVKQGSGKAVVLAVGENTLFEQENLVNKDIIVDTSVETPLQIRLGKLATKIGKYAYISALLICVVLQVYLFFRTMGDSKLKLFSGTSLLLIINNFMVAVAILIVCVPEGMPLSVSIATAFSVSRLEKEKLLIKDMAALETTGQLTDIIVSKTSTLTTGELEVSNIYL